MVKTWSTAAYAFDAFS